MRHLFVFLSTAVVAFSFQTAHLQQNFSLAHAAMTIKDLASQLSSPREDLSVCLRGLFADLGEFGFGFTPEEQAGIDEDKNSLHGFGPIHSKEEFLAEFEARLPSIHKALIKRKPIADAILAKLDPEAARFVSAMFADALELYIGIVAHIDDPENSLTRASNAVKEMIREYHLLPLEAKESLDAVLCWSPLAEVFEPALDAVLKMPENFNQCMAGQ